MGGGGSRSMEQLGAGESRIDGLKGEIKNPKEVADAINGDGVKALTIKYKIGSGDTLSKIASTLGRTTAQIAKENNISNPNVIAAGKDLNITLPEVGVISRGTLVQNPDGTFHDEPETPLAPTQAGKETLQNRPDKDKFSVGKQELSQMEDSIKKAVEGGAKFTQAQQSEAHKHFQEMAQKIQAQKLLTPAQKNDLLTQLTNIQQMYDKNVGNSEV